MKDWWSGNSELRTKVFDEYEGQIVHQEGKSWSSEYDTSKKKYKEGGQEFEMVEGVGPNGDYYKKVTKILTSQEKSELK